MGRIKRIQGDDVLEGLALAIVRELEKERIDKATATLIAVSITQHMRIYLGGQTVYFPKAAEKIRSLRDNEIFKAFDGTNYQALALQYKLSEMRIRQIIDRAVKAERSRRRAEQQSGVIQ